MTARASTKKAGAKTRPPTRNYSQQTIKILFALCGNRCAEPSCTNPIIAPQTDYSLETVLGQISHIYAAADDGPRGKPDLTAKERNAPDNLILLCPTHHVVVDKQYETYPAPLLRDWKDKRERPHKAQLSARIGQIGYVEIEFAAKALMATTADQPGDLSNVPPKEKIEKNGLGQISSNLLLMGSAKSKECQDLIVKSSQLIRDFGHRLRAGFVTEYRRLRTKGLAGDDLFMAMYDWAAGSGDRAREAAGLEVSH